MASRLTFREKCPEICWQRQIRDKYLPEGSPNTGIGLGEAKVRAISRSLAKQIIFKYEWLGTMSSSSAHYGIFFDMHCAGAVCIAIGTGTGCPNTHMPFGIKRSELAILTRGACVHWAPSGANSKLVSYSVKLAAREYPIKLILAYSDSDAGEIGTIYQACNWVYIGKTATSDTEIISPTGRVYHRRIITEYARQNSISNAKMRKFMIESGWRYQKYNPKGRYVFVLDKSDKDLIDRVESMCKPYPKRNNGGSSDLADTSGVHLGKGGSIPTLPLQVS